MKIGIAGCGYVGLVSGACFASFGFETVCVDTDRERVASLRDGVCPIHEPGLESLLVENLSRRRLRFSSDLSEATDGAEAILIAVGTPGRGRSGRADMRQVLSAAEGIAERLDPSFPTVVATKSTVPVGSARRLREAMRSRSPSADFEIASNPEFLREGSALEDFLRPDRIVAGADSDRAADAMRRLYRPLTLDGARLFVTDLESAELIKYASNAFLAAKVAFVNELSDLCESLGGDIDDVAEGLGLDGRIGSKFLRPGPSYGGSCFPKDTRALAMMARDVGSPMTLVEATIDSNERRKTAMVERIVSALGGDVRGKRIAFLGVSFKPDTDDVREAASLSTIPPLLERGASATAHDPVVSGARASSFLGGASWSSSPYDAALAADALVLLTDWSEYRSLDMGRIASSMRSPLVIDFRNVYRVEEMESRGIRYVRLGLGVTSGSRKYSSRS